MSRGEEAELLGWQQWLLLQVRPPGMTRVWGKLTACLYRAKDGPSPTAKLEPSHYPRRK